MKRTLIYTLAMMFCMLVSAQTGITPEVLKQLETNNRNDTALTKDLGDVASSRSGYQLSIFQLDDPVLSQIRDEILTIDINNLTPMEALNKLYDIKGILTGKKER